MPQPFAHQIRVAGSGATAAVRPRSSSRWWRRSSSACCFAILEVALMFFASQVLETVTQDAARMIMTGQAQNLVYTKQQFKDYVCNPTAPC